MEKSIYAITAHLGLAVLAMEIPNGFTSSSRAIEASIGLLCKNNILYDWKEWEDLSIPLMEEVEKIPAEALSSGTTVVDVKKMTAL